MSRPAFVQIMDLLPVLFPEWQIRRAGVSLAGDELRVELSMPRTRLHALESAVQVRARPIPAVEASQSLRMVGRYRMRKWRRRA